MRPFWGPKKKKLNRNLSASPTGPARALLVSHRTTTSTSTSSSTHHVVVTLVEVLTRSTNHSSMPALSSVATTLRAPARVMSLDQVRVGVPLHRQGLKLPWLERLAWAVCVLNLLLAHHEALLGVTHKEFSCGDREEVLGTRREASKRLAVSAVRPEELATIFEVPAAHRAVHAADIDSVPHHRHRGEADRMS